MRIMILVIIPLRNQILIVLNQIDFIITLNVMIIHIKKKNQKAVNIYIVIPAKIQYFMIIPIIIFRIKIKYISAKNIIYLLI